MYNACQVNSSMFIIYCNKKNIQRCDQKQNKGDLCGAVGLGSGVIAALLTLALKTVQARGGQKNLEHSKGRKAGVTGQTSCG